MKQGRRSPLGVAVQLLGFLAGIALLVWCGLEAFKPANREQLARLGDASVSELITLFALSLATLVLNGLIFWAVLIPEKRLKAGDVLAINAIASMLAYLPFKLSVVARVAIHNRRDGVPLLTIAAWFGAVAVLVLTALGPVGGASLWRRGVDGLWWLASGAGVIGITLVMIALAGLLAGDRGLERIQRALALVRIGFLHRALRSRAFGRLHGVFGMLAHPGAVWGATAMRLADLGAQTARFVVAASILGVTLSWEQAVLVASTYFLIGMLTPFGMLGTREAGSVGLASLLGMGGEDESLVVVILAVSASETLVTLAGAAAGAAWLRADRLLRVRRETGRPGGR
jgi:hypothetical protein